MAEVNTRKMAEEFSALLKSENLPKGLYEVLTEGLIQTFNEYVEVDSPDFIELVLKSAVESNARPKRIRR